MSTRSESFGRLLKGAINSIAAYEGKTAPAIEEELGQQLGLAGSAIQRYKAGYLPPEPRAIALFAEAGVRRGFLARAWLSRFLQAARYPHPEALLAQLAEPAGHAGAVSDARALPSGTLTFLFTDIQGSTTRWEQQPRAMERALERHDTLLRQAIDAYGGLVLKTVGDAFQAVFTTTAAALEAVLAAQHALAAEAWVSVAPLRVRMALHVGVVQQRDGDYFGHTLNRVARLCAAGHGGQILLSNAAQELVYDSLPAGAELLNLGEHQLKDLSRRERIFQVVAPGLPVAFPPLNTLDRYRHNLPPQATPLVGREAEAEQAGALLDEARVRLLTLTGPGGIGKTRLALQVAAERLERYRDGVVFVPLAEVSDPEQVVVVIAQALGVHEQGGQPLLEQLQTTLKPRELLLVLDNFEQVVAAAPAVGAILAAAPDVQALVTSRETLKLYGEQEFPVPPLTLPEAGRVLPLERLAQFEAVRLFIERAQAVRPDFAVTAENAPYIAEICARLDGLPLALELAAARSKLFPPKALLARLDQRLRLLSGGPRDLPARQQTLTNAIAWSYDLLDAAEQVVFTRLAVFVGGCTLEAAEAVVGDEAGAGESELAAYVPREAVLDGLSALVDRSLVRQVEGKDGEPRFVMLETIRAFALERLAASGEEQALRNRHAQYFHDKTEHHMLWFCGPDLPAWLSRYQAAWPNIRAAIDWSLAGGDPGVAVAMLGAYNSYSFWSQAPLFSEALALIQRALHSGAGTPWMRARARLVAAEWTPTNELAAQLLQEEGGEWEPSGDPVLEMARRGTLIILRSYNRAKPHDEHALYELWYTPLADREPLLRALGLNFLAEARLRRGDAAGAQAVFADTLALFRRIGCVKSSARTLRIMAASLDVPPEQREAWLGEAERLLQEIGDNRQRADVLLLRATFARIANDYEQAQIWFNAAEALIGEERHLNDDVLLALNYGPIALGQGDVETAARTFKRALSLTPPIEVLRYHVWYCLAWLVRVAHAAGDSFLAARRIGMTDGLYDHFPLHYSYPDLVFQQRFEETIAATRAALGDEVFEAAFAAGKALPLEQAVAEVLATSLAG